jgi:hypothetical protein
LLARRNRLNQFMEVVSNEALKGWRILPYANNDN